MAHFYTRTTQQTSLRSWWGAMVSPSRSVNAKVPAERPERPIAASILRKADGRETKRTLHRTDAGIAPRTERMAAPEPKGPTHGPSLPVETFEARVAADAARREFERKAMAAWDAGTRPTVKRPITKPAAPEMMVNTIRAAK